MYTLQLKLIIELLDKKEFMTQFKMLKSSYGDDGAFYFLMGEILGDITRVINEAEQESLFEDICEYYKLEW